MKLNLKNPIVFFDLETTGTNITSDRIVEICYLKVYPNGNEESKTMRINPEMHIPEASTAIHGIHDEDVADCPTFKQIAKDVAKDIDGSANSMITFCAEMLFRISIKNDDLKPMLISLPSYSQTIVSSAEVEKSIS